MTTSTTPEPLYYAHTGQAPFASTTVATIASWIVVTILAFMYGWADLHLKFYDIISVLILGVFAAGMGFAVFGTIKAARVRSIPVAIIISGSSALLALYVSWVSWEYFVSREAGYEPPLFEWFRRPDLVWEFAREINKEGTFSLRSGPVTGIFLWLVWVVEALAIVCIVGGLPPQLLRNLSFCETCGRWCPKPQTILRTAHTDAELLRENMERKNFSFLASLPPADRDTPLHLQVELCACATCDEMNLLTVSRVTIGVDNKGNRQENTVKVVNRLHVSAEEADELRELKPPPDAQRAPAPDSVSPPDAPEDDEGVTG